MSRRKTNIAFNQEDKRGELELISTQKYKKIKATETYLA